MRRKRYQMDKLFIKKNGISTDKYIEEKTVVIEQKKKYTKKRNGKYCYNKINMILRLEYFFSPITIFRYRFQLNVWETKIQKEREKQRESEKDGDIVLIRKEKLTQI